jgi:GTP:adenosylcobinamide-phosphate guanylyltransferase
MASTSVTALVMAGGRIGGEYARVGGTQVKALVRIAGRAMLESTLDALRSANRVARTIVVGPGDVRDAAMAFGAEWTIETPTLLGNVQAAVAASGAGGQEKVLLIGSDLAEPRPTSIDDFLARSPDEADFTAPIVSRLDYERVYPSSPATYVKLKEGEITMGSQFLSAASLMISPPPAVAAMLGHRKSQIRMARTLGPWFVWRLVTGALTIAETQQRVSELLGAPSAAVMDCAPDLAFDVDDVRDLTYATIRASRI